MDVCLNEIQNYAQQEIARLNESGAIITPEYQKVLDDFANGKCLVCQRSIVGGKIERFKEGKKYIFNCGHTWTHMLFSDSITIHDSIRARMKKHGIGKFVWELLQGWFPSGDPKLSKGVFQKRLIDKENNQYEHLIVDQKTGTILHKENERLSDHHQKKK